MPLWPQRTISITDHRISAHSSTSDFHAPRLYHVCVQDIAVSLAHRPMRLIVSVQQQGAPPKGVFTRTTFDRLQRVPAFSPLANLSSVKLMRSQFAKSSLASDTEENPSDDDPATTRILMLRAGSPYPVARVHASTIPPRSRPWTPAPVLLFDALVFHLRAVFVQARQDSRSCRACANPRTCQAQDSRPIASLQGLRLPLAAAKQHSRDPATPPSDLRRLCHSTGSPTFGTETPSEDRPPAMSNALSKLFHQ